MNNYLGERARPTRARVHLRPTLRTVSGQ